MRMTTFLKKITGHDYKASIQWLVAEACTAIRQLRWERQRQGMEGDHRGYGVNFN